MTQNAHVPAREPVSDILSDAARLSLGLQPGTLPSGTSFLHAVIDGTLNPPHQVLEPRPRRIALDTTVALCANHAGEPLVPTAEHRLEHLTARCLALHDVQRSYVARAFRRLGIFCGGGIPASSLKDRANPVRDEHIRRVSGNGADYHALARCHDPAPRVSARSSIPAEPLAVTELTPRNQERIIAPFLNVHATAAGVC